MSQKTYEDGELRFNWSVSERCPSLKHRVLSFPYACFSSHPLTSVNTQAFVKGLNAVTSEGKVGGRWAGMETQHHTGEPQ